MVVPAVLETILKADRQSMQLALRFESHSLAHLVKSIEFRPRAESLDILAEEDLCRRGRVHHHHRNVAQLDLVHRSKPLGPYPILFRSVDSNLGQVPYQWQTGRAFHALDPGRGTNEFIEDDVDER